MGITSRLSLERILPNAARFHEHQILDASRVFLA
jgi:hypothetical protein